MSTKICVAPVNPKWKDTVTLGQLEDMIAALGSLGFDASTPVTYLYDHRHVWLETVHDVDDDDVDIEVERVPRVWQSAREIPVGTVVVDRRGLYWRWDGERRYCGNSDDDWDMGWPSFGHEGMVDFAPFTEVLS